MAKLDDTSKLDVSVLQWFNNGVLFKVRRRELETGIVSSYPSSSKVSHCKQYPLITYTDEVG